MDDKSLSTQRTVPIPNSRTYTIAIVEQCESETPAMHIHTKIICTHIIQKVNTHLIIRIITTGEQQGTGKYCLILFDCHTDARLQVKRGLNEFLVACMPPP